MFPQKAKSIAEIDSKTYPLGEKIEHYLNGPAMALVALSHTPVERRLYTAMLMAMNGSAVGSKAARHTTQNRSECFHCPLTDGTHRHCQFEHYQTRPRGLVAKFSVEREVQHNGNGREALYRGLSNLHARSGDCAS